MHLLPLLPLLTLLTPVWSWGMLGHRTTALLASRFLDPNAARQIRQLLKPQSLVAASTWADYYSHTPEGRFSAPWHWIDARDSPPHACSVSLPRDCDAGRGCITSAIANHTRRALDPALDWHERQNALRWVVHFVGDVHQPLHAEHLLRGGNGVLVLWDGRESNLHRVWDSAIAEKHVGGNSVRHAAGWADALHGRIDTGAWGLKEAEAAGEGCADLGRAEECVLRWATEANAWMCAYVLPATWPEGLNGTELGGDYYEGAVEIVEELVAKAGWRMGMWLNAMFAGENEAGEIAGDNDVWDEEQEELLIAGEL